MKLYTFLWITLVSIHPCDGGLVGGLLNSAGKTANGAANVAGQLVNGAGQLAYGAATVAGQALGGGKNKAGGSSGVQGGDSGGTKTSAGSGGDPHFRTYDGTMYSFHGQCDLVMARSSSFGLGLGLDVHARTEMIDNWSLISNAAVRIGHDIFEVTNDGTAYWNGVKDGITFPIMMAGGQYAVTNEHEIIEVTHEDGSRVNNTRSYFVIALGEEESIWITAYKQMISIEVNGFFEDTEGMLGVHTKAGMVGRDRETVYTNPNDMGLQWQVRDEERMLFHQEKLPQYPEECILPAVISRRRRLRQTPQQLKMATTVCADIVSNDMRNFCIDDVITTGDTDIAKIYSLGF